MNSAIKDVLKVNDEEYNDNIRKLEEKIEELEMIMQIDFKKQMRDEIKEFAELREAARAEYDEHGREGYRLNTLLKIQYLDKVEKLGHIRDSHPFLRIGNRMFKRITMHL